MLDTLYPPADNWSCNLQTLRLQHTSSHILETFILPLNHTILLRCVGNRVLHLNTCIFTIINELRIKIFTTIIRFEDLESPPILVLNQGLENLVVEKNSRLEFKEVNPTIPRNFIYEGKKKLGLTYGHMREGTIHVTMDELKRCWGSLMTDSLILMLWMFS